MPSSKKAYAKENKTESITIIVYGVLGDIFDPPGLKGTIYGKNPKTFFERRKNA